ncbi:secreted protein containing DUF1501 [Rhodopirellula maiorica SM1]|uniref:Secreted protein containing DUF1501 n=1 Tax=Rhodopirellula maiorica SM1 TaxID=1265738 RepID=M5RUN2_9BACT|nr:DUF1501 domain-containing protein [Rhodopirellula maiorica]EMI23005.1 secreted protein containing DUF1501 [Rhodopirellula maiorica SM1]
MTFQSIDRRRMLSRSGMGLGMLALAGILSDESQRSAVSASEPIAGNSLSPRPPHFPARAKRVIHLFANGGPSQIDTFDPKPDLAKFAGKTLSDKLGRDRRLGGVGHPSTFKFTKHGECGTEVSELFPNIAKHVDKMCVIRSMVTDVPNHEPGLMMMNCGDIVRPRPSVGSWALYGLGTENQSLPGYVVMCPRGLPTAATANWRNAFLPGIYQGTHVDTQFTDPEELVANIENKFLVHDQQRRQFDLIQDLNRLHLSQREDDQQLTGRIESLELAFRMQGEAREAFDISDEPEHIQKMYGDSLQGRQMLIARRLSQRGVRYVQVYHGAGQPWDSHAAIEKNHPRLARECDQPIAALLADLEQQGLLDETLVIWGGEMGRTPTVQMPVTANPGRDHHDDGFTVWMAGGGVKGGMTYGTTDEVGLKAVENRVHVHDLHATILHLLGFDHTRLTYRYAGRDFRLTDVHGNVQHAIIA